MHLEFEEKKKILTSVVDNSRNRSIILGGYNLDIVPFVIVWYAIAQSLYFGLGFGALNSRTVYRIIVSCISKGCSPSLQNLNHRSDRLTVFASTGPG